MEGQGTFKSLSLSVTLAKTLLQDNLEPQSFEHRFSFASVSNDLDAESDEASIVQCIGRMAEKIWESGGYRFIRTNSRTTLDHTLIENFYCAQDIARQKKSTANAEQSNTAVKNERLSPET